MGPRPRTLCSSSSGRTTVCGRISPRFHSIAQEPLAWFVPEGCSGFKKAAQVQDWVVCFVNTCQKIKTTGHMTMEELGETKAHLIWSAQVHD